MALHSRQLKAISMEREMTTHQRGIVDMCLEEGQFESAIAVLEQLRSTNYRPAVSHIRQLIYISLQSEHPLGHDTIAYTDVPSSPSKTVLKKRLPSQVAVLAARRLLRSFAITNIPESIAQALPFCDDPSQSLPRMTDDGSLESVIGPESTCIAHAKSCWHILTDGFTQTGKTKFIAANKGRKRAHDSDEEDVSAISFNMEQSAVGKDAWSVLEWLIILFERDEAMAFTHKRGYHSDLLLRQIPYPRSGSGPRWDTEMPLRIVFYCLEQSELRRQTLGSRLMMLLINLSATEYLDSSMFVASVYSHLTAAGLEKLSMLFSGMNTSLATQKFKIMMCYKLLTDSPVQPKSGNRVQPRALHQKQAEAVKEERIGTKPSKTESLNNLLLPRFAEIQQLLEKNATAPPANISPDIIPRIKFELLNSYRLLQSEIPQAERDTDWLISLRNGGAARILSLAFKAGNHEVIFRDVLSKNLESFATEC